MEDFWRRMNPFDADYYLRGPETGKSNYRDYRWLPELTIPACQKIAEYLGMTAGESVIDCGAALGFYVKGFRALGYRAFGYDVSPWAVANCDVAVKDWMTTNLPDRAFDWATLKDVAEHIPPMDLIHLVSRLSRQVSKGMLFIVPLTDESNGRYVRDEDERDSTHVIRWTLQDWMGFLEMQAPEFNVNASYHIHGIKPASAKHRHSCGFLTLIRP